MNIRKKIFFIFFFSFFTIYAPSIGQAKHEDGLFRKLNQIEFKPEIGFQLWSTYTIGQENYNEDTQTYYGQGNLWNNQLRRSRVGFTAKPNHHLAIKFTSSIDLIGADPDASTQGGTRNASRRFQLWNMYLRYQPWMSSDLFHVTFGFMPPQVSRESIVAALRSSSFDKSWSQNYLRKHLVGVGNGRTMGVNFGGQQRFTPLLSWSYDIGGYTTPDHYSNINNALIKKSPLFTGRLVIYIGDTESDKYSTSHKVNYFGRRNGLSIGSSISYQGETPIFKENTVLGFDALYNHKYLTIDGELSILRRKGHLNSSSKSHSGFIRFGYSMPIFKEAFIEPVFMYTFFDGEISSQSLEEQIALGSMSGEDEIYDFTINYHINTNFKMSISYINNNGSGETRNNNYYVNSEGNHIKRGNLIAVGCVILI